jgi:hypothetical protein
MKCKPKEKDQETERQVVALSVLVGAWYGQGFDRDLMREAVVPPPPPLQFRVGGGGGIQLLEDDLRF